MIRQLVVAALMAVGLGAQSKPSSHLVDLFVFGPAAAADAVATVTDSTGSVIPGVTISATHSRWTPVKCVTNIRGECSLAGIPPTTYRLEAALSGFVTQAVDVDLADGQSYRWNVKMAVAMRGTEDLVAHIEKLTGAAPIDCGRLRPLGALLDVTAAQARPAMECATAAALQRKPFWTSIQRRGIDSLIIEGLVGTADGVIYRFDYDSAPCGGFGCPSRFATVRCPSPILLGSDDKATFACSGG